MFGQFVNMPVFGVRPDGGPLHSLHILNNRRPEPYWYYMNCHRHFEAPVVIFHDEDHRPPRHLTLEQVRRIFEFLKT